VEQYNTESKVNYRQALEKIHVNTEAQTKDKQTNNEVITKIIIIIAYYKTIIIIDSLLFTCGVK
jgi:hypothetical protein